MFLPLCFAIVLGYLYLLANSIIHIFSGETKIDGKTVGKYLLSYLKAYVTAFIYITLIGIIVSIIGKYYFELPTVFYFVICIVVAWLSGKVGIFKIIYVQIAVAVLDIVLSIVFRIIPISLNIGTYIFTAILVLCQLTIRTNLYDVIKTENVKKGMILSTFSSLLMQDSKIEDLPGISTENLSSRLSEKEAECVRRWGESKKGKKEVAVVKKIPFAIFIFAGFVLYFVIWSFLR